VREYRLSAKPEWEKRGLDVGIAAEACETAIAACYQAQARPREMYDVALLTALTQAHQAAWLRVDASSS